ncbi:hypothetical protein LXL04_023971 [Taraxacum kok-saghyz]
MGEMRETEVMIDRSRLCSSQVRSLRKLYMPIKVVVADNVMVKVDIAFKFKYTKLKWIQKCNDHCKLKRRNRMIHLQLSIKFCILIMISYLKLPINVECGGEENARPVQIGNPETNAEIPDIGDRGGESESNLHVFVMAAIWKIHSNKNTVENSARLVAGGGEDRALECFDMRTRSFVARLNGSDIDQVTSIEFDGDGGYHMDVGTSGGKVWKPYIEHQMASNFELSEAKANHHRQIQGCLIVHAKKNKDHLKGKRCKKQERRKKRLRDVCCGREQHKEKKEVTTQMCREFYMFQVNAIPHIPMHKNQKNLYNIDHWDKAKLNRNNQEGRIFDLYAIEILLEETAAVKKTLMKNKTHKKIETQIRSVLVDEERDVTVDAEDRFVIPQFIINSPPLAEKIRSDFILPVREKPLVSSRFGIKGERRKSIPKYDACDLPSQILRIKVDLRIKKTPTFKDLIHDDDDDDFEIPGEATIQINPSGLYGRNSMMGKPIMDFAHHLWTGHACLSDFTFVITEDFYGIIVVRDNSKITSEVSNPGNILGCFTRSNILRLTGGKSHHVFLGAFPSHPTSI